MSYKNQAQLIFPILAATTLFLATACKKSSNDNGPSSATFSATIQDTVWQASYTTAIYYKSAEIFDLYAISFKTKGDSSVMQISFSGPIQLNQPIITGVTGMDVAYYDQLSTFYWGAGTGQGNGTCVMKITSYDSTNQKIGGTISGSLYNSMLNASPTDSVTLTNGQFNISYTVAP